MKINFVYDFIGPSEGIPNGITENHYSHFWEASFAMRDYFSLQKLEKYVGNYIEYHDVASLKGLDIDTKSVCDLYDNHSDNEIYLYPISTSGKYHESLGYSDNTKQSVLSNISINAIELLNRYDNFFIYYEHIGEPDFNSDILKKIYDECVNIELDINNILIVFIFIH